MTRTDRAWGAVGRIASIGTLGQIIFAGLPAAASAALVLATFVTQSLTLLIIASIALFVGGASAGVTVGHGIISRFLMRRQSSYEVMRFEIDARFGGVRGRRPVKWHSRRTIRALQDGIDHVDIFVGYGNASEVVMPEVLEGGVIGPVEQRSDGRWYAILQFERPLAKRERHTIHVRWVVPETAPDCPPYCTVTPMELVENVSLRIEFDSVVPDVCWGTYWLSDVATVAIKDRMLRPTPNNVVEYRKRRTKPGHRYGLTWEWPSAGAGEEIG